MMGEELISIGNEGDRETFRGLKNVALGSSIGGEYVGFGETRVAGAVSPLAAAVVARASDAFVVAAATPSEDEGIGWALMAEPDGAGEVIVAGCIC
jgi:hypothetical protein